MRLLLLQRRIRVADRQMRLMKENPHGSSWRLHEQAVSEQPAHPIPTRRTSFLEFRFALEDTHRALAASLPVRIEVLLAYVSTIPWYNEYDVNQLIAGKWRANASFRRAPRIPSQRVTSLGPRVQRSRRPGGDNRPNERQRSLAADRAETSHVAERS
jgi:hypothetical protein